MDMRDEVDDVAGAGEQDQVAWLGREEDVPPSFCCGAGEDWRSQQVVPLPEGLVEVGDIAAGNWVFEGGIDRYQHHLVRFGEGRGELVEQGLRTAVAVRLEEDAEPLGLELRRHADCALQFGRMVRVIRVDRD